MAMRIDVIATCGNSPGWAPIVRLGRLAADLLGGQFSNVPLINAGRWRKLFGLRPRRRGQKGRDVERGLLIILRYAHEMNTIRQLPAFRDDYRFVAVWIIDSPLTEKMPLRGSFGDIDLLGVMRPNDVAPFRRVAGERVVMLGWGSDVLASGGGEGDRGTDILRIGRQPTIWDDDAHSMDQAFRHGLVFKGRPPLSDDPETNQRTILEACKDTKFVLAHSNRASPAAYTHPTQEYITARWTDALACGATVAGKQPVTDLSMGELLWPGATLDFDRIDMDHNLDALSEAVHAWTPDYARQNHLNALQRLDWRWRLKVLTDQIGIVAPKLETDLSRIRDILAQSGRAVDLPQTNR